MGDYSPTKEGYNKNNLTELQAKLLECLAASPDGDVIEAARQAGYANPSQSVKQNAQLIKDFVEDDLSRLSAMSVKTIEKVLTSECGVPQAGEKLKAAGMILERTHPKTDKIDVSGEVKGGVFILPDKRPLDPKPNE